jgi:hypothetical protein
MTKHFAVFIVLILASFQVRADDAPATPAFAPPIPSRAPANMGGVEPLYDTPEPAPAINKNGRDGARIEGYWDPMSTYSKMVTNTSLPSQFGYQGNQGGIFGMQAMWSVWAPSDWEFQTGVDYMFPINVQGQQTAYPGYYTVNGQTLNMIGLKLMQVNYRFNFGDFTIAPYAGFGIYYGKDSVTLSSPFAGQQTDLVNYSKLLAVYTAGARADYNFNRNHTIAGGVGFEFFVPTKFADDLSQSGSTTSELPGQETYLQSNMDFMTGVGVKLMISVAGYF